MTKSELKTGMIVTRKDGIQNVVYRDVVWGNCNEMDCTEGVLVNKNKRSWNGLSRYNEDLTHKHNVGYDIIKVEKPKHPYDLQKNPNEVEATLLWVREEAKKMTVEEIEKILGYKVEIVSNQ